MQIFKWVYIILASLATIGQVYLIDKPRKPLTPGTVIINMVLNIGIIIYLFNH